MNKQRWLESALDLIDKMPRDEFLSALRECGVMDAPSIEVTYPVAEVDHEGHVWRCEFFRMDDELVSCFLKTSNSAPQGALSQLLAA